MPPKSGTRRRGGGRGATPVAAQAARDSAQLPPPHSPFASTVSWQTPMPAEPPKPKPPARGSTADTRGRGRGRGRGQPRSMARANHDTQPGSASPRARGTPSRPQPESQATDDRPSSHFTTLKIRPANLRAFPSFTSITNSGSSEPFSTLVYKALPGSAAGSLDQAAPSPLPSLISCDTDISYTGSETCAATPGSPKDLGQFSLESAVTAFQREKETTKPLFVRQRSTTEKTSNTSQKRNRSQNKQTRSHQSPTACRPNALMAPVKDNMGVHVALKDTIQHLYDVQATTHAYVPDSNDLLVDKFTNLTNSLAHLQTLTSKTASPHNPIHQVSIAPEIIDYVDDGRNPDIFTREFVENVQRGNAVVNGKRRAFKDFSQVLAGVIKTRFPGLEEDVNEIMDDAGFVTGHSVKKEIDGQNGT